MGAECLFQIFSIQLKSSTETELIYDDYHFVGRCATFQFDTYVKSLKKLVPNLLFDQSLRNSKGFKNNRQTNGGKNRSGADTGNYLDQSPFSISSESPNGCSAGDFRLPESLAILPQVYALLFRRGFDFVIS